MANSRGGLFGAILLTLAGCSAKSSEPAERAPRQPLALLTTLPIYWPETEEFGDILKDDGEPGWVRASLEKSYTLQPLDTLDEAALARFDRLLLAQPRALSPAENVALDEWVRGGGRLLLFADPMLTRASRFPIGDRRRPQDVVLLSPILARWGLELTFDPDQPEGERVEPALGEDLPVNLSGAFRKVAGSAPSDCSLSKTRLAARCRVGKGTVTLVADAALFDGEAGAVSADRERILEHVAAASLER